VAVAKFSVARLTLTDFRSYGHLRLETDARPVVLTGANGAGKTNLLEALSFLVPGRGLRNARLGEVARREAGEPEDDSGRAWAIAAAYAARRGPRPRHRRDTASLAAGGRERRIVRIDGDRAQPSRPRGALRRRLADAAHGSAVFGGRFGPPSFR